ncbi:hypothetical protein ACE1TF_15510 [Geomicrobium sp. JSM 1781026]|uniref:hypothetical protein n=1 Tax=Geomicrobium sp. JSM 1781026 TaxID=3344580 RepID=UPI0035C0AC24
MKLIQICWERSNLSEIFLSAILLGSVSTGAISDVDSENLPAVSSNQKVVEVYETAETFEEYLDIYRNNQINEESQSILNDGFVSNAMNYNATFEGENMPNFTVVEKSHTLLDIETNEENDVFLVTDVAYLPEEYFQDGYGTFSWSDEPLGNEGSTVTSTVGAYVEASTTQNNVSFYRISEWRAQYTINDHGFIVSDASLTASAAGENLNGDYINPDNVSTTVTAGSWSYLSLPWSNEYIASAAGTGQGAEHYMTVSRGSGSGSPFSHANTNFGADWF